MKPSKRVNVGGVDFPGRCVALQSMVVTIGFLFTFVLLLMCVSIVIGLHSERKASATAPAQA